MYNKEEIDLIKYFIDSGIDFEKFEGIRNEERYPAGGSVELIFDGKPLYIRNGFSRYYIGYLKRDERNGSISNIPKLFDYFDNYRFKSDGYRKSITAKVNKNNDLELRFEGYEEYQKGIVNLNPCDSFYI